jgi:hypothetical protein
MRFLKMRTKFPDQKSGFVFGFVLAGLTAYIAALC